MAERQDDGVADSERDVRASWQYRAARAFEGGAMRGGRIVAIAHAAAMIDRDVPAGGVVIDVGCGTGLLAMKLPRHRVVGVDFSAPLLAAAARRAASVAMASAFALPFRDGSVAAVVCLFVVDDYQASEKRRIVGELLRVSSAGAMVVLGAYAPSDERMGSRRREFSDRIDSQPVFLERAGFYVALLLEAGAHGVYGEEVAATGMSAIGEQDQAVQRQFLLTTGQVR
jgi:ubiquinone/menaquinone biosynthesis C-methylase UbiE